LTNLTNSLPRRSVQAMPITTDIPLAHQPLEKIFADLGWVKRAQQRAARELIAYASGSVRPIGEYAHVVPSALGGDVDRALEEGEGFKSEVLARNDMLAPEAAAARARITRQALDLRRKRGQALALAHAKRGFRYPAWQFADALAEPMMEILPRLAHLGAWERYLLLTEPEPLLEGASVVESLRSGKLARVRHVVQILAQRDRA
jgi:hypothetical protein